MAYSKVLNGFKEIDYPDVHAFIKAYPGSTGEEIRIGLNAKPERVGYLLGRLRESGHLRAKGVTRAMKYTATAKKLTL